MSDINRSSPPSGLRRSFVAIKGWFFVLSVVGLVVSNVTTLVNNRAHDYLYTGLRKMLLVAGESLADHVLSRSPTRENDAKTHRYKEENEKLKTENKVTQSDLEATKKRRQALEINNKKLTVDLNDMTSRHSKLSSEFDRLSTKYAGNAKAAKGIASTVRNRLAKGVARNTLALPAESIPYLGVGATLAVTALDIYDACSTMRDINGLLKMMGQGEEKDDFCGQKLPTTSDVLAMSKSQWNNSMKNIAAEARTLPASFSVPPPQVRLPTTTEVKATICPTVNLAYICE